MARKFTLKKEIKALGAAQIIIGLIYSAIGALWMCLFKVEDRSLGIGLVPMYILINYSFLAGGFFINSGGVSVIQGAATVCKLVVAVVMNIISAFVAIIGLVLLSIDFALFEAKGNEFIWSNLAGMMLVQFLILITIAELVLTIFVIHWIRVAFRHEEFSDESCPVSSEPTSSESIVCTSIYTEQHSHQK